MITSYRCLFGFAGNKKAPVVLKFQSKTTGADMKKETGFYLKSSLYFPEKMVLCGFGSLHCVKNGVWYLRKRSVFFDPSDMQKTQEKPGFFDAVSFLFRKVGAGSRSRTGTPSLAADFESATSTNSIIPANQTCFWKNVGNRRSFWRSGGQNPKFRFQKTQEKSRVFGCSVSTGA